MKYKNTLLVITQIFPLVVCNQVKKTMSEKIQNFIADASEQQNEKEATLFQAVIDRDQSTILSLSEANLRQELLKNSQEPMQIYASLSEYMLEQPQENKSL